MKLQIRKREAAHKGNNLNPTPTRIHSTTIKGAQELAKDSSPILSEAGIDERARKESIIEWVNRRFGTSKEELKELNVTTNHSCHEIPSQTYDDYGKLEDINKVNSGKALWSDEVEYMEAQLGTKNTAEGKKNKDNNQTQNTGNLEAATVNPSSPITRVYDNSSSKVKQLVTSVGGNRGTLKELGIHAGLATTPLAKNQFNGTVNLSNFGDIFTIVDGVPVYALRSEQVGDVNMVLEKDTMGSNHQTVDGKVGDPNGSVVFGNSATVNPSLGSVYELQFKMMQENLGIMERNSELNEVSLRP